MLLCWLTDRSMFCSVKPGRLPLQSADAVYESRLTWGAADFRFRLTAAAVSSALSPGLACLASSPSLSLQGRRR